MPEGEELLLQVSDVPIEQLVQTLLVGSKFSCGMPVVEFQQASQPLAHLNYASGFTDSVLRPRKKNDIPFPLVISFTVKMKNVIGEHLSQRCFAEQDHFRQTLLFYGSMPPFQIGVQIWTPRRQLHRLDSHVWVAESSSRNEVVDFVGFVSKLTSRVRDCFGAPALPVVPAPPSARSRPGNSGAAASTDGAPTAGAQAQASSVGPLPLVAAHESLAQLENSVDDFPARDSHRLATSRIQDVLAVEVPASDVGDQERTGS